MNIFTANQVNQVYVINADSTIFYKDHSTDSVDSLNGSGVKEGSIYVGQTKEGELYFAHKGKSGITRSDLIPSIMYYKVSTADQLAQKYPVANIKVNSKALSSSNTISGQDYILNIEFQNPIGMSPDNKYIITAAVHSTGQSQTNFMKALKTSLEKNMKYMKEYIEISESSGVLTISAKANTDYIRGIKQQKPIYFKINNSVITDGDGKEVYWVNASYSNGTYNIGGFELSEDSTNDSNVASTPDPVRVPDTKTMADYEYFYMGERGDQYRMKNYPDYVPTQYMIDPANDIEYDTLGIHFAYVGSNHAVQKSEKDITFIVESNSVTTGEGTEAEATTTNVQLSALIAAINAVAGDGTIIDPNAED